MKCSKLVELCSFMFVNQFAFTVGAIRDIYRRPGESSDQFLSHETPRFPCFSRGLEDNVPHNFTAPLCLRSDQYRNLRLNHVTLIITNLPPRTNRYVVHYGDLNGHESRDDKLLESVYIRLSDLKPEENKVWLLLCSDDSTDACVSKIILYRIPSEDINGKKIPRPQECPLEPDFDLNPKNRCLVQVFWNSSHILITEDTISTMRSKREARKPLAKKVPNKNYKKGGRRKAKPKPKAPVRTTTTLRPIRTTPAPPIATARPNTKIKKLPVASIGESQQYKDAIPYQPVEGSPQMLSCESDGMSLVQWEHTYRDGTPLFHIPPAPAIGKRFNINFTPELFDNDTFLACKGKRVENYHLSVTPYESTSVLPFLYYNNDTVNYNCNEYNLERGQYATIMSILPNNTVKVLDDNKAIKFTESDNGTILFCSYFVYQVTETNPADATTYTADISRYVAKKSILIYNNTSTERNASNSPSIAPTDAEKYYIGAAVAAGLIIILVIIFLMRKKYRRRKEDTKLIMNANPTYANVKETPAGHKTIKAEESMYAQVGNCNPTYAELDLGAPSRNKRPNHEDSPYAQIMNPNATYADIKDAPYAEIVNQKTALYAQPDMSKKTKVRRLREEETTYAEIANVLPKK